jgi:hypothetical protein
MTALSVSPMERGVIRVFALDLPARDLARLTDPTPADPSPQATVALLIGLDWLEADGFEIFDPEVLGDLRLSGYLRDGGGVAAQDLTGAAARLDAINSPVLLIYSRAFAGTGARLTPAPGVTHVATLTEDTPPVTFEKLPGASATGLTGTRTAPGAPGTNPHVTLLLALLALPLATILLGLIIYGVVK